MTEEEELKLLAESVGSTIVGLKTQLVQKDKEIDDLKKQIEVCGKEDGAG